MLGKPYIANNKETPKHKKMIKFGKITEGLTKIIPSFLQDHDKKLSSKRIFKLGGGGSLIYTGIEFLNQAADEQNTIALYSGIGCILVGTLLAVGLSEKIKQVQIKDKNDLKG